jgi:hypothetical protein
MTGIIENALTRLQHITTGAICSHDEASETLHKALTDARRADVTPEELDAFAHEAAVIANSACCAYTLIIHAMGVGSTMRAMAEAIRGNADESLRWTVRSQNFATFIGAQSEGSGRRGRAGEELRLSQGRVLVRRRRRGGARWLSAFPSRARSAWPRPSSRSSSPRVSAS